MTTTKRNTTGVRRNVSTRTNGVFRREPQGTYMATWTDLDGRRRTKTCATFEAAKAAKAEAEDAKRRGEHRPATSETVGDYLTRWLDGYTGRTNRGVSSGAAPGGPPAS